MKHEENAGIEMRPETEGRREVMEMHLFDDDATREMALCKADTLDEYRRSGRFYVEDRLHGAWVGTICKACKSHAVPFAVNVAKDLEANHLLREAEDYRQLSESLLRETVRHLQRD